MCVMLYSLQLERQHDDETLHLFTSVVDKSRQLRSLQEQLVTAAARELQDASSVSSSTSTSSHPAESDVPHTHTHTHTHTGVT